MNAHTKPVTVTRSIIAATEEVQRISQNKQPTTEQKYLVHMLTLQIRVFNMERKKYISVHLNFRNLL